MSYILAGATHMVRRWALLLVAPALVVCSSYEPSSTIEVKSPGTVSDLNVSATTDATATLSFSQVDDGTGQPAKYDVRYASGPMAWGSAASVANGSCATPLTGTGTSGGISCDVGGLSASTSYNFQVVAFRGTLNSGAVFGGISNVASGTTTGGSPPPPPPPPPSPVVTTVTVSPASASVQVGATVTLQAIVKDQNGIVMTGQSVSWSSNNGAASVNSSGVVTGVSAGSATITAVSSGISGTAAITVTSTPPPAPVVTTVTVSPASASVVAGSTVTLQATVKDQNGNVMSGQTVGWTSGNTAAATVNSSGVVSGVAAGNATITATSSGKSGTSSITVTAPPPPPPPGGTLLFHEDYEDANIGSRGWYDNTNVQLSTTEHIAGSTASAQYHFLAGATGVTSGGAQRHKFTPSSSVYISYYVKYSSNWVGSGQPDHPHEFYILSSLDGDYDGLSDNFMDLYVEENYLNGGRPRVSVQDNLSINSTLGALPNNLINVTENRSTSGCNGVVESNITSDCFVNGGSWYNDKQLTGPVTFQPNPGPGYKNNWNFVEVYFQLNTISNGKGVADGVIQYWFNGTLIFDRHDILFRTGAHPTLQLSQLVIGPYIGDGSPVDQSMWIDNLRVATGRIP